MAIVTLKEMLQDAQKRKYAVGMFDVHNLEMTNAVIKAAEEEHSPVILALAEAHAIFDNVLEEIANIMVHAAKKAKVPVCVHFDHGTKLEHIVKVMHLGFSSVMFDGSVLPYEDNVKDTAEITRLAAIFGATVEAELGHVGGVEGGGDDGHEMVYTNPDEALDFVKKTRVDALAVSIGTAHGAYKVKPKLDINRLRAIRAKVDTPLVLHGGSGLTDLDFKNCVQAGIAKINIYTEIVQVAMNRIQREVNSPYSKNCSYNNKPDFLTDKKALVGQITAMLKPFVSGGSMNYPDLMRLSTEGMKAAVKERMRLFGSSGKA